MKTHNTAYATIDEPRSGTGDTWIKTYATEAEALAAAARDWSYLTRDERKKRTICAAVGRLDDDGKFYLGEYTPIKTWDNIWD